MSTFSIQQLRQKYKKIIESEDSGDQDINKSKITFAVKKGMSHTRVLTEHCENISKQKTKNNPSNTIFVALKERIAQGIQNLSQKDQQMQTSKEEIIKQKAQINILENQIVQIKSALSESNEKIVQEKINAASLQKQIQRLKIIIKDQSIEKQLIFKQIEFYKKQIKDVKNEKKQLQNVLNSNKKQLQKTQRLKNDNSRLKENIERMQVIINQCCQQSVKVNLTDKYYLGKPLKESNCWFSQNLVGEVESFLRKWQIGHHNKEFIDGLVKFIDQYQKESRKSMSDSKHKATKSRHKVSESNRYSTSVQISHNASNEQKSRVENTLKKSILLNKYKKKNNKIYTCSLFDDDKDVKSSKIYEEMLDEYEKALKIALQQSQIKPKKIMLLSKELKQSFSSLMDEANTKA